MTVWPAYGLAAALDAGAAGLDAAAGVLAAGALALAAVLAVLAALVAAGVDVVAVDLLDDEHAATRSNAAATQAVAADALLNRCDIGVSISGTHDQTRSTLIRNGHAGCGPRCGVHVLAVKGSWHVKGPSRASSWRQFRARTRRQMVGVSPPPATVNPWCAARNFEPFRDAGEALHGRA